MGYYTSVHGEIEIQPPIPWGEVKDSKFIDPTEGEVHLRIVGESVETAEGTLIRRSAVSIEPFSEDPFKAYSIVAEVQEIVDQLGDGRTFVGRFDCSGEDSGDLWRLEIQDGRAVRIQAQIVWPNGEVERGRS